MLRKLFARLIDAMDRPHHRDWRPAPASARLRRWTGTGWEYRPMTAEEAEREFYDNAW